MLSEFVYKFQNRIGGIIQSRALDLYGNRDTGPVGHVLVSYVPLPLVGDTDLFRGHSNVWECAEIVNIFNRLGYAVDLISWQDASFVPRRNYDAVFDIHGNLVRYAGPHSRTIFHMTGSNPLFSNHSEQERLAALNKRHGVELMPRRAMREDDVLLFFENARAADVITLIGNEVTAATYPADIQRKIRRVTATGAYIGCSASPERSLKAKREFLWFNGSGAVHKGLDITLELFSKHPEWILHIVGPYLREKDFVKVYHEQLFATPNIHSHGFLYPTSKRFLDILDRVSVFISPACSEGISTSAITCMQLGLIPIISKNSGITIDQDLGYLLESCSNEEIESAVTLILNKSTSDVFSMRQMVKQYALNTYSRNEFSRQMNDAIQEAFSKR